MNPRRPPLHALTGARFLAAFGVVGFHLNSHFGGQVSGETAAHRFVGWSHVLTRGLDVLAGAGSLGVNFFFLLSGFVLAYNYLAANGLTTTRRAFYVARFARIYPLYLAALLLALGYRLLVGSPCHDAVCAAGDQPAVALSSVGLVQAWLPMVGDAFNGPGWTLSVETFFYACFPFLIVAIVRLRSRRALLAVLVGALLATQVGPVIRAVLAATGNVPHGLAVLLQFSPLIRLPEFVIGVAAWTWVDRYGLPRVVRRWADLVLIVGVPLLLVAGVVLVRLHVHPLAANDGLFDVIFLMMILALASGQGVICRVLGSRVGQVLGESSYALYVLHWPVWFWFTAAVAFPASGPTLSQLAAYTGLMLAVAVLAWFVLERPSRRWIIRAWSGRRARPVDALSRPAQAGRMAAASEPR